MVGSSTVLSIPRTSGTAALRAKVARLRLTDSDTVATPHLAEAIQ